MKQQQQQQGTVPAHAFFDAPGLKQQNGTRPAQGPASRPAQKRKSRSKTPVSTAT